MDDAFSVESKSLQKAEAKIEALGLPRPEKPEPTAEGEVPTWPGNVADLGLEDLAHHMSWWTGWSAYARYHLARAETNAENFDEEYGLEMDKSIFASQGDYDTVTVAKAAIRQRGDMIKIKKRIQEAKALVKMVKSLLNGYEEKYATISREISRRGVDFSESTTSEGRTRYSVSRRRNRH